MFFSSIFLSSIDSVVEEVYRLVKENEKLSCEEAKIILRKKIADDFTTDVKKMKKSDDDVPPQLVATKKPKRKIIVSSLHSSENPTPTLPPPPPPPIPSVVFEEKGVSSVKDDDDEDEKKKKKEDKEDESLLPLTLTPTVEPPRLSQYEVFDTIKPEHKNLPIDQIIEPLPAVFWKNPRKHPNDWGDLYCTREEISSCDDNVDVILCKNQKGELRIIGTIYSADLPVVTSEATIKGRGNHLTAREHFISKLMIPSTFEYGCELLVKKGIQYGKYTCFL